jgi:Cu(I)/Ag(I) efflux system membrane fusion protein
MTIANPDILRASFNVYEKDLAGIKLGQKVLVKSIAYPDRIFEGEIVFISPAVDENTRAIKIRVDVKNEEHLLKFGMFVTGDIVVPVSEPVLTIPEVAIQEIEDVPVVFVPSKEEKDEFNVQKVKPGQTVEEQVEILSGLSEGEEIVGKGSFYLKSELLKGELEEGHAH